MDVLKIINYNWIVNLGIIIYDENYKSIEPEAKKLFWLPDNLSQNCFSCENKFSLLNRQHHCRICGNIFCSNCSNKQIQFSVSNKNGTDKIIKIKVCDYCLKICINFDIYMRNNIVKTMNKYEYFCKYIEVSKKNNEKFLDIEDIEKENEVKNNINLTYDIIIQNMVKSVLKEYFDDDIANDWKNVIYKIIIEVISNLRNSYLFLDDSLDINKYIKIKQIEYKDNSLSEVIPGLVIKSNQNKDFEKTNFINPKLLLINLENNLLVKKLNNFSESFKRNNGYINIILQKINYYNPDVIIIGKNYPVVFRNDLSNNSATKNKCILFDMKKKHFEEITRSTANIILPSFNLIGSKYPFGKCKKFYIKKVKSDVLLVFEGYSPKLYNSIILSGNNNFLLRKMKMILRNVLLPSARDIYFQKYLLYAFNMKINNKIDKEYIYNMFESNKKFRPNQLSENCLYSTFELIMNKFDNNGIKLNKKYKPNKSFDKMKNKDSKINNNKINNNHGENKNIIIINSNSNNKKMNDINECFYNGFDLSLICKKRNYINFSLIQFSTILNENKINNISMINSNQIKTDENSKNSIEDTESLDEKEVQKQFKKCKKYITKNFFSFFSSNKFHDKTIFEYLYNFFKNSKKACKYCNEINNKHLYKCYKIDGIISIKFITEKEYDLDKVMTFIKNKGYFKSENLALLFNVYTYGYCKICKNIVTPLIRLNNEILNYSTAKLFRFFLENLNIQNNHREYKYNIKDITKNDKKCNHLINRNISRIFLTELGSCVFDYSNMIKYFIDPININVEAESNTNIDINANLKLNNTTYNIYNNDNFILIEQLCIEAFKNSKTVLDIMNELFNSQITISQNLLTKDKLSLFNNDISSLINISVLGIKLIETFKKSIFKYMTKEYLQESDKDLYILKYNIIIKKIYLKIIQIKSLSNTILKYINEFNIISDILYSKIPYSYKENYKLHNKIEMPMTLQTLEKKREYLNIISFLEYYDNRHNFYDVETKKDDLSSIISDVLSSDDYINFIDNNNNKENNSEQIKFSEIRCKRINNSTLNEDEIKKNINTKKNNIQYLDINDLYDTPLELFDINKDSSKNNNSKNKYNNINTKILENSSMLFNLNKNIFSINKKSVEINNNSLKRTEEENKKILEFLKHELLLENKEEFNITLKNDLASLLENYYNKNDISILSKEKLKSKEEEKDDLNDYFKDEEEEDEKNEIKENEIVSSGSIHINLFDKLNDDLNKLNAEMITIKNQLNEFDKGFIENQRQLNIIIKNSISEQKQNNLSRESSASNLFKVLNRSRRDSVSSKGSNDSFSSSHSRQNSDIEYKEYGSKSFKLDSTPKLKLIDSQSGDNEGDNTDKIGLPKFSYMPEFLKIFELKKFVSFEDKIISKHYPEYEIKIYYPRQFQALRTLYFSENFENFIFSCNQSEDWEMTGGKSKANFFRSLDEKFAIKNISELEFNMLIDSGPNYFNHLSKFFFENKPCLFAKILGAFHIKVKHKKEKEKNYYLIYMENIYYNFISKNNITNFNTPESNIRVYDLKGSEINRYIRSKEKKKGKILLDTNFLEDMGGEPLFLDFDNYKILNQALINDCKFLKKEEIIDYSLVIIFEICDIKEKNENKFEIKRIRMGIVDYLRKYTWDKQIESYGKKLIHGFGIPTIINPEKYSERFIEKIKTYFACV